MTTSGLLQEKNKNKNKKSEERRLQVLGENLQLIMKRLGANQKLLRYLYYTDKDPLSTSKKDLELADVYEQQLKIIPIIGNVSNAKSIISLRVLGGTVIRENSEMMDLTVNVEVFVPTTQWILKGNNLRPFLIMGEISNSLDKKTINGLGKMNFHKFTINFLTEEMSAYQMMFTLTQFN